MNSERNTAICWLSAIASSSSLSVDDAPALELLVVDLRRAEALDLALEDLRRPCRRSSGRGPATMNSAIPGSWSALRAAARRSRRASSRPASCRAGPTARASGCRRPPRPPAKSGERARHDVVRGLDDRDVAVAAQRDVALAVLHGLDRVRRPRARAPASRSRRTSSRSTRARPRRRTCPRRSAIALSGW